MLLHLVPGGRLRIVGRGVVVVRGVGGRLCVGCAGVGTAGGWRVTAKGCSAWGSGPAVEEFAGEYKRKAASVL